MWRRHRQQQLGRVLHTPIEKRQKNKEMGTEERRKSIKDKMVDVSK